MNKTVQHIILVVCFVTASMSSFGQENDTIVSDSINLKWWYEYQVNYKGEFINYADLCDTSSVDTIEKFIPNCISARVYITSVTGVYWVKEYYFQIDSKQHRYREGFVKAVRIKRRFFGIPIGTKGCHYQKTGNWKDFVRNSTTFDIIKYGLEGPICTDELPKHYMNIK